MEHQQKNLWALKRDLDKVESLASRAGIFFWFAGILVGVIYEDGRDFRWLVCGCACFLAGFFLVFVAHLVSQAYEEQKQLLAIERASRDTSSAPL